MFKKTKSYCFAFLAKKISDKIFFFTNCVHKKYLWIYLGYRKFELGTHIIILLKKSMKELDCWLAYINNHYIGSNLCIGKLWDVFHCSQNLLFTMMPFSFYCLQIQSLFEIIKNVYIESYYFRKNESILLLVISDKRRLNCGLVLDTVFRYYAIFTAG